MTTKHPTRFEPKMEMVIVNGRPHRQYRYMSMLNALYAEQPTTENEILFDEEGDPLLPEVDEPR